MGISLIADSSCDLPVEIIEKYGIIILPVSIYFPNETRTQYIDITTEEFFHKITTENITATTGVPSPKRFKKAFDEALEKNEEVIMLCLSKELSGIHSSAILHSRNMTNNKITVVDIRTTTVPFGLVVLKVARMIKDGLSRQQILDRIYNDLIPKIRLNAFVGSLKYLKRSGRIDTLQHLFGELFQFKPLITIIDGKLESSYRVRGEDATITFLENLGEKVVESLPENETLVIVHSRNMEKAQNLEKHLQTKKNKPLEILIWEIGPAIGVHVGPGALGLTWVGKAAEEIYHFK